MWSSTGRSHGRRAECIGLWPAGWRLSVGGSRCVVVETISSWLFDQIDYSGAERPIPIRRNGMRTNSGMASGKTRDSAGILLESIKNGRNCMTNRESWVYLQ